MSIGAIENSGDYADGDYAGGIVGNIDAFYPEAVEEDITHQEKFNVVIKNCLNKGKIKSTKGSAAGIICNFDGNLKLEHSYNSGEISAR